ncbi:septum formation family protein [Arthrobacter sp. L77]|uniref:septum formation family protein n=1 Tax=Arthrobacter sp. L77 TaxID=1496689 RepID=UPI0005B8503A|nr:septum formation family protein [Arthrobacter sp. L77]
MSNEEQAPREPGHGPGPDGTEEPESTAVLDPDTVVLEDPDISADTLEPELTVSPDTLDLAEPALEPAQISPEVAEAASLDDAAAEARAVAAEAAKAGTLVGGPLPPGAPSVEAAPAGSAPAGGAAGDAADRAEDTTGGRADDRTEAAGVTAEGAIGGPYAFPPEGGETGSGDPGPYPGFDPRLDPGIGRGRIRSSAPGITGGSPEEPVADPRDSAAPAGRVPAPKGGGPVPENSGSTAEPQPTRDRTRSGSSIVPLLLLVGGAVVLLGLLVWLLLSLLGGSEDEDRVDPSSLAAGECLAEFTDITEEAVLVDCSEPHNAQLVASEDYADDAAFPGRDQLGLRAEAACAAASSGIDPDVVTEDLRVTLLRATPTEGTWADGDRRVDCFAVVEDGGAVSQSLLTP